MGKKKGGAKNKLARMSEEERARYLQHRADIEEEAKRRKQQLIAMYMKNKLKKEDAFTRLNLAKINQEWRFILRQIKCKEMRCEIKEMEHLFSDCVDRKNRMIRRLLCDLDESEEIYSTMLHTHMENIEKLVGLHKERLKYLQQSYEKEKKLLLEQNDKETKSYKAEKEKAQRELEAVYYGLEEYAENRENVAKEKHLKKLDDLKNMMSIKLENLTKEREIEMENLWKEFQNILNGYLRHKEQYRNEYIDLRRRDSEDTRNIKNHYLEVARNTELITELKSHFELIRDEHEFGLKEFGKYKIDVQLKYNDLKKEFEKNLLCDKENFKFLIVISEKVLKKLKDLFKKGENILQLSSICRKMETEEEKILPFGPKKKMLFQYSEDELRSVPEIFEQDKNHLLYHFENFWIRYNTANLDCSALEEERAALKEENRRLKDQLKDYLTNVTVATGAGVEITDGRFVQRPSSMKIEKIIHIDLTKSIGVKQTKRRPVTCIEGNLSVAVRSQNIVQNKYKLPECVSFVNYLNT